VNSVGAVPEVREAMHLTPFEEMHTAPSERGDRIDRISSLALNHERAEKEEKRSSVGRRAFLP
jgi:hypothetical protein